MPVELLLRTGKTPWIPSEIDPAIANMKTKEELNALKNEVEALNKKLAELSDDELSQVSGGTDDRQKPPKKTLEFLYNAEDSGHKPGPLYSDPPPKIIG